MLTQLNPWAERCPNKELSCKHGLNLTQDAVHKFSPDFQYISKVSPCWKRPITFTYKSHENDQMLICICAHGHVCQPNLNNMGIKSRSSQKYPWGYNVIVIIITIIIVKQINYKISLQAIYSAQWCSKLVVSGYIIMLQCDISSSLVQFKCL